jgi:membrane protein implicated in regulation of membrane protease activity
MIVGGVVLFVIGAILAFGVSWLVPGVSLQTIGGILMVAGGVLFVIGLVQMFQRRGSTTVERTRVDPASGEQIRSRSTDVDPGPR